MFSGRRLKLYLSILFNLFALYGYVPNAFHQATIIPLVKCKSSDLTDVNNYRAIALSNSITKILESLLFSFIESHDMADEYQFGFKKTILPQSVLIFLKKLSIITGRMVVMYSPVLLILTKHLTMLIFGYYFVN
jgi:hypothetical protein